ncbi:unnamed protein product [Eruca vesicaria subsp. sativa]|uniref:RING-type domain-containing protein n=1 Tax=Eruca vesicaria subsp. sativa TaxID=29727 RepID=A0ABC8J6K3_ERUVS|nr:unnamed protein product [Eruca vesicaria subsp. sativa]
MVMEKKITALKAKRQDMKACFTCPICNNLYDRATTISECLHTFCRKCIEDKLVVENLKACPVCNVDLGVAPLDKLRSDNTWDELRLKVFKQKPKSVKAAEAVAETASTSLTYSRKKKTSLPSSLVTTPPRVSTSPEPSHDPPLETEKLEEEMEAVSLNKSSSTTLVPNFRRRSRKKLTPKRNDTQLEPQQYLMENGNGLEIVLNIEHDNGLAGASTSNGCIQKVPVSSGDLSKSLSNGTILNAGIAITPNGNTEEVPGEANEKNVLVSSESDRKQVSGEKPKNNGVEKQEDVSTTSAGKISGKKGKGKANVARVLRPRKQGNMSSDGASEAATSKEAENKVEGSNKKVWLSLIAASNQNTGRPLLPQISSPYLRTDGNLSVSYVKKYLAYKLGLQSENQVEIWLRQEPVSSTQKLHNLVDWWVQSTPIAERKSAMVGSSGAEFVMVLHYSGSHLF